MVIKRDCRLLREKAAVAWFDMNVDFQTGKFPLRNNENK